MNNLCIPVVIHENVQSFGDTELTELLGKHYFVYRTTLCPSKLGWASQRPRQFCVLIEKQFMHTCLSYADVPASISTDSMMDQAAVGNHLLQELDAMTTALFSRQCDFTCRDYFTVAMPEEIAEEQKWASERPKTKERFSTEQRRSQ